MIHYDLIQGDEASGQFGRLLDRSFPVPEGGRFFDDFPVWDPALDPAREVGADGERTLIRVGAFASGRLAGCAAARLAQLKSGHGSVAVAIVGAVATEPELRGQGVATRLVDLASRWAIDRGAQAVLLWGSEHTLYERLGFSQAGEQVRLPLSELKVGEPAGGTGTGTGPLQRGWNPALFDLLQRRPGGLVLEERDRSWLTAHKNVEWFWIAGERGAPIAYAAYGRGIDLRGHVHEWGGDPGALARLLAAIRGEHPEALLLSAPEPARQLGFQFGSGAVEPLCLAKPAKPGAAGPALPMAWIWGLDSA